MSGRIGSVVSILIFGFSTHAHNNPPRALCENYNLLEVTENLNANTYAITHVSLSEISKHVTFEDPNDLPEIILAVSPVRSGTTAMLRVFGAADMPAHYQPMKALLRWCAQDEVVPSPFRLQKGGKLFIKETIGTLTKDESTLNPLKVLQLAYVEQMHRQSPELSESTILQKLNSKIKLVVMGRDPRDVWASTKKIAGESMVSQDLLANTLLAQATVQTISEEAERAGIPVTHWVYESAQNPQQSFQGLFSRLGIATKPRYSDWASLPSVADPASHMIFPAEPANFKVDGIHDRVFQGSGYEFFAGNRKNISDSEMATLKSVALPVYNRWRERSERDLGMSIKLPNP
jgi:hypothetical protein